MELEVLSRENLAASAELSSWVIPVLKEAGHSSGFFVNQIRRRLSRARGVKRFKVGHAGTLDPFAEGVLIVLCGRDATRQQSRFMQSPKTYETLVRFGETTETLDIDGDEVTQDGAFALEGEALHDAIEAALPRFVGEIQQVPPIFSAVHVDGRRAYDLARKGEHVELKAKTVRVDDIELVGVEGREARVRVTCGSGFYVRSFARDLAEALGTIGYLRELKRTMSSGIRIEECVRLREVLDSIA